MERPGGPPRGGTADTPPSIKKVRAEGFSNLAGKSAKGKSGKPGGAEKKRRGRPSASVAFDPEEAGTKKGKESEATADLFQDRKSADEWLRGRLTRQVNDYDFLIDQLRFDLTANTKAAKKLVKEGKGVTSELMRSRQSILTSMRTLMGGQQELMISLMKSRNLLGDLGGEDEGGDVIINVQRLPPEESTDGGSG